MIAALAFSSLVVVWGDVFGWGTTLYSIRHFISDFDALREMFRVDIGFSRALDSDVATAGGGWRGRGLRMGLHIGRHY